MAEKPQAWHEEGSLKIIEALEQTFALTIPDEDLTEDLLDSVQSLADYVGGRLEDVKRPV